MYLMGRVVTNDGSTIPTDMMVERICVENVRQQVYAAQDGSFNMQLGSRSDTVLDASAEGPSSHNSARDDSLMGVPRHDLANCELRASAAGFRSRDINLVVFDTTGSTIDVGTIVVQRSTKIQGMTLSATAYQAPKDARKAYEKGLEAVNHGKLAEARKYFETAVAMYPKYVNAWFQLGTVLQKQNENDAARKAFAQSASIDNKFLPPYLSLASMAYHAEDWTALLSFTSHILELDPLNHTDVAGYILDLDPLNYAEAYFYNAVAEYRLKKFEAAEKSALKAEHLDLRTNFLPQLHFLLGQIFTRKNDYANAIFELKIYLELVPHADDADQMREQLAQLEKLNASVSTTEKSDH